MKGQPYRHLNRTPCNSGLPHMAEPLVFPIRELPFFFFPFFFFPFFSTFFLSCKPMHGSIFEQYFEYLGSLQMASSECAVSVLVSRFLSCSTVFPDPETKVCIHTYLLWDYRQCYRCGHIITFSSHALHVGLPYILVQSWAASSPFRSIQ